METPVPSGPRKSFVALFGLCFVCFLQIPCKSEVKKVKLLHKIYKKEEERKSGDFTWKSRCWIFLEELKHLAIISLREGQLTTIDRTDTLQFAPVLPLANVEVERHLALIIAPALLSALHLACLAHLRYLPNSCRH